MKDYMEIYQEWLSNPYFDEATKAELRAIEGNEQEIVNLVYPMHYRGGHLQEMWKKNADRIAGYLEGEKKGVFLTLGDPSVYSTFMYTLPYMKAAGIDTEIIPGVTSFCAAAASAPKIA